MNPPISVFVCIVGGKLLTYIKTKVFRQVTEFRIFNFRGKHFQQDFKFAIFLNRESRKINANLRCSGLLIYAARKVLMHPRCELLRKFLFGP